LKSRRLEVMGEITRLFYHSLIQSFRPPSLDVLKHWCRITAIRVSGSLGCVSVNVGYSREEGGFRGSTSRTSGILSGQWWINRYLNPISLLDL
jgi:hypothetical protein